MRFNPYEWEEINVQEIRAAPKGRLWLRCSEECSVYLTAQGYEVLGAVGREIDLTLSEEVTFLVEAPASARVFLYKPHVQLIHPEGEVFTNADRMPSESGAMMETRRALRLLQLEQQAVLRQMREQQAALTPKVPIPDPAPLDPEKAAPAPAPVEEKPTEKQE